VYLACTHRCEQTVRRDVSVSSKVSYLYIDRYVKVVRERRAKVGPLYKFANAVDP
jgi:hypothetical protein